MIIWFPLVIPIIGVVLMNVLWREKVVWWENILPPIVTLIVIALLKVGVEKAQVTDIEYWTGWVKEARYYEDWNELVTYTETETDSKGNSRTVTKTRVDYHPAYWQMIDSNSQVHGIKQGLYKHYVTYFGNRKFKDLHRSYHTNDGDLYYATWPGTREKIEPVTTLHTYENRVQASNSIFKFPKVSEDDQKRLLDYPHKKVGTFRSLPWRFQPSILTQVKNVPNFKKADSLLTHHNARLGKKKQIRIWLLVFGPKTTLQDGMNQESFWQKGNKNELNLCVGLDNDNKVTWVHVFSWTEAQMLTVGTRDEMAKQIGQPVDLVHIVEWLIPEVQSKWVRKQFADFSYLTVEPPAWGIVLAFIVAILVTGGCIAFAILNDIDEGDKVNWGNRRRFGSFRRFR